MTSPSIKDALEAALLVLREYDFPGAHPHRRAVHDQVKAALATLQPSGERREAIARIIDPDTYHAYDIHKKSGTVAENGKPWCDVVCGKDIAAALAKADRILASGLVQDEAGWRDISTAPKDGTPFIGAFWTIRWADSHRKGDVVTCWWQPEFEAFISSCREMSLAPGLTFENGETSQLHSPVIEPVTHWRPLDRPIRSARDGGES